MRRTSLILLVLCSTLAQPVIGEARVPDYASISVDRPPTSADTSFTLSFGWDSRFGAPGFSAGQAVEFKVVLDTTPPENSTQANVDPKCFAQPVGGKDNNLHSPYVTYSATFPMTDSYVVAWNYYWPTGDPAEAESTLLTQCPPPNLLYKYAEVDLADYAANHDFTVTHAADFGVGILHPATSFEAGVTYSFTYYLQVPPRSDCRAAAASWGMTSVYMKLVPNTCTLTRTVANALPVSLTFTCPILLGAPACNEVQAAGAPQYIRWIDNLCSPTARWCFHPSAAATYSGRQCQDLDGDHYFATAPGLLGTRTGDCNDNDPSVYPGVGSCPATAPTTCCTADSDCDDHNWCNGDERCDNGVCDRSFPRSCPAGQHCDPVLHCVPDAPTCPNAKDCSGLECGPDRVCGLSCGDCSAAQNCVNGQCVQASCSPECGSRSCGLDPVCHTLSCGTCNAAPAATCSRDGTGARTRSFAATRRGSSGVVWWLPGRAAGQDPGRGPWRHRPRADAVDEDLPSVDKFARPLPEKLGSSRAAREQNHGWRPPREGS